eukprot:TRINITY_DN2219_c0_g1_i1.p6 TRINITY_DN2219_c0_g1~~TRINITY_DN2219_c0_g1_i1.p6  ORF type:complete len:70 (+),score=18.11 TRINITY_DN2219_c0_g1_i1:1245-1454(+)
MAGLSKRKCGKMIFCILEISNKVRLFYQITEDSPRIPLACFRLVMSSLLGFPQRWDWKKCQKKKSMEES